jgi:hypothetical protein
MSYMYSAQLAELLANGYQCPPLGSAPIQQNAWRWVANPLSTQCFAPVAIRNPPRLLRAADPVEKCSCWGLSMHTSYAQSVAAFLSVQKSFRMARKIFGGHVANLLITPSDGACTAADRYGHFDFHPYSTGAVQNNVFTVQAIL